MLQNQLLNIGRYIQTTPCIFKGNLTSKQFWKTEEAKDIIKKKALCFELTSHRQCIYLYNQIILISVSGGGMQE